MQSSKASNWPILLIFCVPITQLPLAYVVSGKIMFSVVFVCSHEPHLTTTLDAIGQSWDPWPPNMFKLV